MPSGRLSEWCRPRRTEELPRVFLATIMTLTLSTDKLKRFWSLVDRTGGPHACWLWIGPSRRDRVGWFTIGPRQLEPHRIAFRLGGGTIPYGLVRHRTCRTRRCCNPKHLQLMTKSQLARARSQ
jgi:hypothetical protein